MHNEYFTPALNFLHSDFDEVVLRLYESILVNPGSSNDNQVNLMHNASERKDQILYYLQTTLEVPQHIKLATDLAEALLEDDIFRY